MSHATPAAGETPAPDAHELEHLAHHVKAAIYVFVALLVLTGVTVAASYLHLPTHLAIALALTIATVKGGLVAAWFMHLISERKLILAVLGLTFFFFFTLLLIPVFTVRDVIGG